MIARFPLDATALCLGLSVAAASCSPDGRSTGPDSPSRSSPGASRLVCDVSQANLIDSGAGLGTIPALHDPALVSPGSDGTRYLRTSDEAGTAAIRDHDRVVVFRLREGWVAVPHNILWWHEVARFTDSGRELVVTYCPLTGSSLVFDVRGLRVSRFEVSGLLFNSNLVMRDPETGSLWPQMTRGAACGPLRGEELEVVPSMEVRWEAWRELHPDTRVVSSETGFDRDYSEYPYGRYETPSLPPFFRVRELDDRRPFKERVLGIPDGRGGAAYPFGELEGDSVRALRDTVGGRPVVVFWDERARAATAFRPRADGRELTFRIEDGRRVDRQTASTWRLDGRAVGGALAGARLEPVAEAYVAFWFAWAVFQPDTEIWTSES